MSFPEIKSWDAITWLYNAACVEHRFSFLPRRCLESKRMIWFKFAYKLIIFHVDDNFVGWHYEKWIDPKEYVMLRLKM